MTESPEEAVLLWAMNSEDSVVPSASSVDADKLVHLALHHRVAGRLLGELENKLPSGLSRLLVTRLRFIEHQRRNRFREQLAYAQSLSDRFSSPENPLIFLKGFSSYAVTGDERLRRPIGDFDMTSSDLSVMYDSLIASGYFGKRHFTHEYGKLSDGQATLDLHEYFPVRGYPKEGWNINSAPLTLPETFDKYQLPDLPPNFVESGISYEDLMRHSQKGIAPGTERLTFPTLEMSCLILCVHAFRNVTITLHYLGEEVLLRLGELADANTLASVPHFDPALFTALVEQHNATDSVTWVSRQCERFFGKSFFPCFEDKASRTAITVEHLSMGNWVYLGEPPLLTRSGARVLDRLGCQTVALEESTITTVPLIPVVYSVSVPECQMQVEWKKERITFHIKLDADVKSLRLLFLHDRYVVCHFNEGKLSSHRFKDVDLPGFLLPDGDPQNTLTEQTTYVQITFTCPLELQEIPCFFEAQTKTSSMYVPLRFMLTPEQDKGSINNSLP